MGASVVSLLLADSRMPTGGHTQSGGLEAAIASGLDPELTAREPLEAVRSYLLARLATVTCVEAGTAVVARAVVLAGGDPHEVVPHWAARSASAALRQASRRQGRGWARTAVRLWPETAAHLDPGEEVARAVVLGTIAGYADLDPADLARVVVYDDAQAVLAAALKLLPLDPVAVAAVLVELASELEEIVAQVADLRHPEEIPARSAPLVEWLGERHAGERMRLFHA